MKIKLTYSLQGMYVSRETDLPAHFSGTGGANFILWLREVEHQGQSVRQLCCDLVRDVKPPERAKKTLLALKENRLLLDDPVQEGLPKFALSEGTIVDLQGNIKPRWIVDFDLLPKGAKPWLKQIRSEMVEQLADFVRTLRWVQSTAGGYRPFSSVGAYWSLDGECWYHLPSEKNVKIRQNRPIEASKAARVRISAILNNQVREPISHDLMREARELAEKAPRSALLVAFAALETGIKGQLKRMIPDASGLIDEIPSPPLLKMFQEILPSIIQAKGQSSDHFPLRKNAQEYLKKWVAQRNQVTHGTKQSVDADKVDDFIQFAQDVLYLLDCVDGHDWALDHLESGIWKTDESRQ